MDRMPYFPDKCNTIVKHKCTIDVKYRVCKNRGGHYKIQWLQTPRSVFGIVLCKAKWLDVIFYPYYLKQLPYIICFNTIADANTVIQELRCKAAVYDEEWSCEG